MYQPEATRYRLWIGQVDALAKKAMVYERQRFPPSASTRCGQRRWKRRLTSRLSPWTCSPRRAPRKCWPRPTPTRWDRNDVVVTKGCIVAEFIKTVTSGEVGLLRPTPWPSQEIRPYSAFTERLTSVSAGPCSFESQAPGHGALSTLDQANSVNDGSKLAHLARSNERSPPPWRSHTWSRPHRICAR